MKPIKRNRCDLHKKKKITAAQVKLENIRTRKQTAMKKIKTIDVNNDGSNINKTITNDITNDTTTAIMNDDDVVVDEPIIIDCNLPKHKAKSYLSITKDRVNISFRVGVDNYSNMVPQISKEIISNFSYKYERRCTTLRHTGRIISSSKPDSDPTNTTVISPPRSVIDGISVFNYSRCYVEDYMTRNVGESLLVMIPSRHGDDPISNWFSLMDSNIPYIDISFTKHDYRGYIGTVTTNPSLYRVQNGMHRSDYAAGFGNHNYGCNITFQGSDSSSFSFTSLITWRHVLEGKIDGVMIWRESSDFRNVYTNFNDRCKTNQGLVAVLNMLFLEVYGDCIQCMHLIHCYHRSTIKMQQKHMNACDLLIEASVPIDLHGAIYDGFLTTCDNVFREAIQQAYINHVVIGSPIITCAAVNQLVESYIVSMQSHFNTFNDLLGFKQKSVMKKNEHLLKSGYYKRQVFYNMLATSRQKNPQKMKH